MPSLKLDDGYKMDLFERIEPQGSVCQFYALRTTATETWKPEPEGTKEGRSGLGIFVRNKRGKQIAPYHDDLYVDGRVPEEYAKMIPSVFDHLTVPFTEEGIMDAWLLHESEYLLPRTWNACRT